MPRTFAGGKRAQTIKSAGLGIYGHFQCSVLCRRSLCRQRQEPVQERSTELNNEELIRDDCTVGMNEPFFQCIVKLGKPTLRGDVVPDI
ncbi:hypothetical protein KIN20_038275 [Parelaphostrongylus tenuis]|uniref:Uncharacterized protein n=1 Tax=Parelaphostrongylus tenuis TaxID=148309 RepID=A0AAD5WLG9_PARTN|nr:hypothetical protein KIN20_038275 [Parelaphostrongylus tenuis]